MTTSPSVGHDSAQPWPMPDRCSAVEARAIWIGGSPEALSPSLVPRFVEDRRSDVTFHTGRSCAPHQTVMAAGQAGPMRGSAEAPEDSEVDTRQEPRELRAAPCHVNVRVAPRSYAGASTASAHGKRRRDPGRYRNGLNGAARRGRRCGEVVRLIARRSRICRQ